MSKKIRQAIQFNQGKPLSMQLGWIDLMDRCLSQRTQDYIEHGTLELKVLAVLIKQSINEASSESEIDGLLWNKLHDQQLVIHLMKELL